MQQTLQQDMLRRRLPFVAMMLMLVSGVLLMRMIIFQLPQDPEVASYLQTIRDANYGRTETTVAERGRIFDRDYEPLAVNTLQYEISMSPNLLSDPRDTAVQLASILGINERDVLEMATSDLLWVQVAKPVSAEIGQQIAQLDIYGVIVSPIARRYYPQGSLAGHILGFVAGEKEDTRGYYGVEGHYQDQLAGRVRAQEISDIPFAVPEEQAAGDRGGDLVLTIDRDIQFLAESELQLSISETGATKGTIIVMNPRNGDILAMANYPPFDPNTFATIKDQSLYVNTAISDQYEPGSIMKVLTIASALDKGIVTPQSTYNDTGAFECCGVRIENWDRAAHGVTDMTQILVQSLNVGAATVSTTMKIENFYPKMADFGIGRPTGIDLEGEAGGILKVPGDPNWSESDLATNSFGQGVSTTPLQMITAFSAIANGGLMMQPRVVYEIIDGKEVLSSRPSPLGRPISAQTAQTVTQMMVATVRDGVDKAGIPGYTIAGKSGTAEIPDPALGYLSDAWIMSFVGFLPADDPQVVVLIRLDKPTSGRWASQVVAPIFSRFVERLVLLLEIPPDDVRHALAAQGGS
jgi:cell division protein FtsI/penicillin-binding protein 2